MCIQLSLSKIKNLNFESSERVCELFKKFARSDIPIECDIIRQLNVKTETLYNSLPHTWPDIFEIKNLFVMGSKTSIEKQIVENLI